MPLKSNCKLTLSKTAKQNSQYQTVETLALEPMRPITVYLESVPFPLLLIKQIFTNEGGSTGHLYLVTSDTILSREGVATIYQKRWNVGPCRKSLKQCTWS